MSIFEVRGGPVTHRYLMNKSKHWLASEFMLLFRVMGGLNPIPMVLHCPRCGLQHVDAPSEGWDNPPHRSHLCHGCGCIWRPADVPTCGVRELVTAGSADNWAPQSTSVDVVGYVDISLNGFLNDPPDDDYQRGYLSALLHLWREGLHRDGGEDRLTRLGDMARADR
jgi:hypothetical protein